LTGEDGELTTINGQESVTVDGVSGDVVATLQDGDDTLYIHDVDLPGNLNVQSGRGNDTVLIGGLPRDLGPQPLPEPLPTDSVDEAFAVIDGDLIATGDPIDPVPVDPTDPIDPVPIDPVPILPRANVTIGGSARIVTGAGDDGVAMGSVEVLTNLSINSGSQNDVIRLGVNELPGPADGVGVSIVDGDVGISLPLDVFGSMTINTGGGDDQAWLESVHVAQNLRANLGTGADLLSYDWGAVSGRIAVDAGAGDDIVALAHVVTDTIVIRTRGGNDGVGLAGVSTGQLNVHLGAGDDQMLIADTSAASARINGGTGIDSLDFQGINHLPSLRLRNFEIIT
jgi:hypothetical protein